jgi:hypothetical protein
MSGPRRPALPTAPMPTDEKRLLLVQALADLRGIRWPSHWLRPPNPPPRCPRHRRDPDDGEAYFDGQ